MKFIFFFFIASCCLADQFVADLADKPGFNTGTMVLEAGVCGLASWSGKALLDEADRRDVDWAPAAVITVGGLLVHSVFFREGGSKAGDALVEQLYETGGAFVPVIFNF